MVEVTFVLLHHIAYLIPLPQLCEFIFENVAISKIKGPHLEEICAPETTSEPRLKIARETNDELLSVDCPFRPMLLVLHDAAPYGPICCGHNRVSGANSRMACGIDKFHNVGEYVVIVRANGLAECRFLSCHVYSPRTPAIRRLDRARANLADLVQSGSRKNKHSPTCVSQGPL